MNAKSLRKMTSAIACAGLLAWASPSAALFMIQVAGTGRVTGGAQVPCDDYGEFAHWSNVTVSWYLNTSLQGVDKSAAIQRFRAAIVDKRYQPTHELQTLRDNIFTVGEFVDVLKASANKLWPPVPNQTACPVRKSANAK